MARMYSRKKGKSKSKKPLQRTIPTWVRYKEKEIELLIVRLAKEGKTPSQIGIALRDTYGIPNVKLLAKKDVTQILKERKLLPSIPEDLQSLIQRSVAIHKHLERNANDESAKRGLLLTTSKINRLVKYYKRIGKLPSEWKYDPSRARMLVE
ncbi:30S ribosomal protein S15 [Candidatus Woesearchaeota archaeon]|nr:30S ribosomal protein S15 [Candidatus Woesearchaeota archaeon]